MTERIFLPNKKASVKDLIVKNNYSSYVEEFEICLSTFTAPTRLLSSY